MVDYKGQRVCAFGKFAGVGGECMEIKTIKRYVSIFGGVLGGMTSDTCSNGDVTV